MTLNLPSLSVGVAAVLAACGGSGSAGGGSMSGTIAGQTYTIQDVVSGVVSVGTPTPAHYAVVVMSTDTDLCSRLSSNTVHPNEDLVVLLATDISGSTGSTPTAPGGYTNVSGSAHYGEFQLYRYDATCSASDIGETSGTITITAIIGDVFTGHFDVTTGTNDHITGMFNPAGCPQLQNAFSAASQPACK